MLQYRLVKRKDLTKGALEGSTLMYPQLVSGAKISFDQLCEDVAEQSSLTSGDVKNAMDRLIYCLSRYLSNGQGVDCGDLGSFRVSLRSSGSDVAENYDASTMMRKPKVNYTPGKKLRLSAESAQFERVVLPAEECDRPHLE